MMPFWMPKMKYKRGGKMNPFSEEKKGGKRGVNTKEVNYFSLSLYIYIYIYIFYLWLQSPLVNATVQLVSAVRWERHRG